MTATAAFSLCAVLAYTAIGLSHLAVWRLQRSRASLVFGLVCLVTALFFLRIESAAAGSASRPNVAAMIAGHLLAAGMWGSLGAYLGLNRQRLLACIGLMALQIVVVVPLATFGSIPRMAAFGSYAVLCLPILLTAWWVSTPAHRRRNAVVFSAVLLYPMFVVSALGGWLSMAYIRYTMVIPMFLIGMSMLVEGLFNAHRQVESAAADVSQANEILQSVVKTLAQGSAKVAASGNVISDGTQMLAMRTDEQASHLQETSASVQTVVDQIHTVTTHVGEVDRECASLFQRTEAGATVVHEAVQSIETIKRSSADMREAVELIQGIATQTTILAINASIEAARCGPAGRGFAVIAGEVRDLAQRTREAVVRVTELIDRANAQSVDGVGKIQGVRSILQEIGSAVEAVAARMRGLSSDTAQQSESLGQVTQNLARLVALTQANASMVADSVMTAGEMSDSADQLSGLVAQVLGKLDESAPSDADQPLALAAPTGEARYEVEFF